MLLRSTVLTAALACLTGPSVASTNTKGGCCSPPNVKISGMNTNNVGAFDCPKTTCSTLSQDQLQAAMNDFAYIFYTEKNVSKAFQKYVASNYVQHNPGIADGRQAAITALEPLFGSAGHEFQIARVMVGPEYTTIHIKATTAGYPSYNVFDVYKTQGSCVIEHWDCLEEIQNTTVSTHPYF